MKHLHIKAIPFSDNYIWSIESHNKALLIDPGDEQSTLTYLKDTAIELVGILITHHHQDHIAGLNTCLQHFPKTPVFGPKSSKIQGITHIVKDGDNLILPLDQLSCSVIETPGHTLDHVSFLIDSKHLFVGDTLFSGGCGRIFEGNARMMYQSIQKILNHKPDTWLYCGHEYTLNNLNFSMKILPNDPTIKARLEEVIALRKKGLASLPSQLNIEKKSNLFCRCDDAILKKAVSTLTGKVLDTPENVFKCLRELKDKE